MQVGDLEKCVSAGGTLGLVLLVHCGATPLVFDVLVGNKSYPFLPHQLELISETR